MVRKSVWFRSLLCAVSAVLLLSIPTMASVEFHPGGGQGEGGSIPLATGPNANADGYLTISPDEFGSWSAVTFGGGGDQFNPTGTEPISPAAFTHGFLLFVGNTQRELLSGNASWQGVFPADASLDAVVTSPSVVSDTNGDFIDDTLTSAFTVSGGSTALSFDLVQTVAADVPGVSFIRQDYVITNISPTAIEFKLVRAADFDLLWGAADFADDEVGTTTNGAGLGTYVTQQEVNAPGVTSCTLSGPAAVNYYGGKNGVEPGLGLPAYGFGTDVQVWDAFGTPLSWERHAAGVGYNTNGFSGSSPPGVGSPADGFVGVDFVVTLGPSEQTTVTVGTTYGQNEPVDLPDIGDGGGDGGGGDGGGVPATGNWGVIALFLLLTGASLYFLRSRGNASA